MFEKDAEEYYNGQYDAWLEGEDSYALEEEIEQAFKDGAEFGYNKANEWHYVKDGLPKEGKQYLCLIKSWVGGAKVYACLIYNTQYHSWQECYGDVIAWKEIVLPELPKENK